MSRPPVNALVVINPRSRRGAEADLADGLRALAAANFRLRTVESTDTRDTERAIEAHHREVELVILGGGDGTLSSVVGLLHRHKLALGILPLGTANDLSRSLGLSGDLETAFEVLLANNRRRLDLGQVNGHFFFNAAQLGLGVQITHELTADLKRRWGVLGYLKALCAALTRRKSFRARVAVDGREYRMRSIHLAVGNGRFYGGGNVIADDAAVDEGRLHLFSVKPQSLFDLVTLAPLIRTGKQRLARRTFTASGRRIEVRTRASMEIHADGEPMTRTPATFEVVPGALEVVAPLLVDSQPRLSTA